jgi:hypothetical protein
MSLVEIKGSVVRSATSYLSDSHGRILAKYVLIGNREWAFCGHG